MRGAKARLGAIAAICALAPAAGFAAEVPAAPDKPASAAHNQAKPTDCAGYGAGFFKLGDTGFFYHSNEGKAIVGIVERNVDRKTVALIMVVEGEHLALFGRDEDGARARAFERLAGFGHLDLLEAFGDEDCDAELGGGVGIGSVAHDVILSRDGVTQSRRA